MPNITFKAKVETVWHMDHSPAYLRIRVPKIERRHCDMRSFEDDRRLGSYSNSNMFLPLVRRAMKDASIPEHIRLDAVPESVEIDTSGFLAQVTIRI
jgi:hypothetical protein